MPLKVRDSTVALVVMETFPPDTCCQGRGGWWTPGRRMDRGAEIWKLSGGTSTVLLTKLFLEQN